jgi:hypothetical protein
MSKEDEYFVGIMAKRSSTRKNRVVWVGEIANNQKDVDARTEYFVLLYSILKNMKKFSSPPSGKMLYLIKEKDNDWYLGFKETTFYKSFGELCD